MSLNPLMIDLRRPPPANLSVGVCVPTREPVALLDPRVGPRGTTARGASDWRSPSQPERLHTEPWRGSAAIVRGARRRRVQVTRPGFVVKSRDSTDAAVQGVGSGGLGRSGWPRPNVPVLSGSYAQRWKTVLPCRVHIVRFISIGLGAHRDGALIAWSTGAAGQRGAGSVRARASGRMRRDGGLRARRRAGRGLQLIGEPHAGHRFLDAVGSRRIRHQFGPGRGGDDHHRGLPLRHPMGLGPARRSPSTSRTPSSTASRPTGATTSVGTSTAAAPPCSRPPHGRGPTRSTARTILTCRVYSWSWRYTVDKVRARRPVRRGRPGAVLVAGQSRGSRPRSR